MNCDATTKRYTIKVPKDNSFTLILPLKQRTYVSNVPIDTPIVYSDLEDVVLKVGGVQYATTQEIDGVHVQFADGIAEGVFDIILTATYRGAQIRAAYFEALTGVDWQYQSAVQQFIQGSPIMADAAFVIGGPLTDSELEELKAEYRDKIAAAEAAKEAADQAKEEYEQKAEELDDVAQQSTLTQGISDVREDISHIDIDTSDLAKESSVSDGNDTAIGMLKDQTNGLAAIKTQAANAASDAADIKTIVGTPASGQPSTLFAAIAAGGGGGGGDAQESTSQAILAAVNNILPSQQAVLQSYATLEEKGVAVPAPIDQTIDNLPSTIGQINEAFVGYAYLSAMTLASGISYTNMNLSGIVFTGTSYSGISNQNTITRFVAPHTTSNLVNISSMLKSSSVQEADITNMDTSSVTTCSEIANGATNLQKLNMRGLDLSGVSKLGSFLFKDCHNLVWIDMTGTKAVAADTYTFNFSSANNCETIVGDYTIDQIIDGDISVLKGIASSFIFGVGTIAYSLGRNSLRALINGLADLTGGTAQTLTIGANYIAKLTAEDIAVATNKNWTLA